ncbi:hypothetical protein HDU93_000847 [Gonapodya sp. JEL0774]|nr:hypothetical protein HDU93_000847 [Gonapodya sp. JEL0774]
MEQRVIDPLNDDLLSVKPIGIPEPPSVWNISSADLHKSERGIADGGFGTVTKGTWRGFPVAIKTPHDKSYDNREELKKEARIWYSLESPNVAPLCGIHDEGDSLEFITPFMKNENAAKYLEKLPHDTFQERAYFIILGIARGMEYLHKRGIIHADLKPTNVLISSSGQALVSDFGSAKELGRLRFLLDLDIDETDNKLRELDVDNVDNKLKVLTIDEEADEVEAGAYKYKTGYRMGTRQYMSPERLLKKGTTKQDDVYAFGVTLFELWTRRGAYTSPSAFDLEEICYNSRRPVLPSDTEMPPALQELMEQCWTHVSHCRPTFKDIVERPQGIGPIGLSPIAKDLSIDREALYAEAEQCRKFGDIDRASYLYERAAMDGDFDAMYKMGLLYRTGLGLFGRDYEQAAKWYLKAAKQGVALAQYDLGLLYYWGLGVEQSYKKSVLWYSKAANRQDPVPEAQFHLGNCYFRGEGIDQDYTKAFSCYLKAAKHGVTRAQLRVGHCYWDGFGVSRNLVKSGKWLHLAAKQGDSAAQYDYAIIYLKWGNGGVAKDPEESIRFLELAAKKGHRDAQYELALSYMDYGRSEDAEYWLRKAAESGHSKSRHKLIWLGHPESNRTEWWRMEALQGNEEAQFILALCYEYGWAGFKEDTAKAARWFRNSVEKGSHNGIVAISYYKLGFLIKNRPGLPKDIAKANAASLYREAAARDFLLAKYLLGHCYFTGEGVPQDYSAAARLYREAISIREDNQQKGWFNFFSFHAENYGLEKEYTELILEFHKLAIKGYIDACANLGVLLIHGVGGDQEEDESFDPFELFRESAKEGNITALCGLGVCYLDGNCRSTDVKLATDYFVKAAEQGCLVAQLNLSRIFEIGIGTVAKDVDVAEGWRKRAQDSQDSQQMFSVGTCYKRGWMGLPQDSALAEWWWKRAADCGYARAYYELGHLWESDPRYSGRPVKNMGYRMAVKGGIPEAQYDLAQHYWNSDSAEPAKWYLKSFQLFLKASEQGHVDSQYSLGVSFEQGKGVAQDYSMAVEWYMKAAIERHAAAKFRLGVCYQNGYGVKADPVEACCWLRKAAEQGHSDAQAMIAICYEEGRGVAQDAKLAARWFRKAADQGVICAKAKLGVFLMRDKSMDGSEEVVKLLSAAAEQGDGVAQNSLAVCYLNGIAGLTRDEYTAEVLFEKAANQGYPQAMLNLIQIFEHGTNSILRDQAKVSEWSNRLLEAGIDADMQLKVGMCYLHGWEGLPQSNPAAEDWMTKAAEKGQARAHYELGLYLRDIKGQFSEALVHFREAAVGDIPEANFIMGCYYEGLSELQKCEDVDDEYDKSDVDGKRDKEGEDAKSDADDEDDEDGEDGETDADDEDDEDGEDGETDADDEDDEDGEDDEYDEDDEDNADNLKITAAWHYHYAARYNYKPAQDAWKHLGAQFDSDPDMGEWIVIDPRQYQVQSPEAMVFTPSEDVRLGDMTWGQSKQKAAALYRRAAEQGDASGLYKLGRCYMNGEGVEKDEAQAVNCYRQAAEQGKAPAQVALGGCYANGHGVEKDELEAVTWYRKAAVQDDTSGQVFLGGCYMNGQGVEEDKVEAVNWYKRAAENSNAEGQFRLGLSYYKGEGVRKDEEEAIKWFRKAAEQRNVEAQLNLGQCYANGQGVQKDDEQAVYWYRRAAEKGNAEGQLCLGLRYISGDGVKKNHQDAVRWLSKAAKQGNSKGQFSLGSLLFYGDGVKKDEEEALKWYRKAADQGDAGAQYGLGYCYENGQGVEKDLGEAVAWYRKAADQGYANAQTNLGVCYANGRGVEKDERTAVAWYRKAADQGYASAQYNLGVCYENGNGVEKDERTAVGWYRKAAGQGHDFAFHALQRRGILRRRLKTKSGRQYWAGRTSLAWRPFLARGGRTTRVPPPETWHTAVLPLIVDASVSDGAAPAREGGPAAVPDDWYTAAVPRMNNVPATPPSMTMRVPSSMRTELAKIPEVWNMKESDLQISHDRLGGGGYGLYFAGDGWGPSTLL